MLKTYLLNQNLNSCTFTVQDDGGNSAQYSFRGGNVITNTRPFLQLENPYFQDLLERSELFKTGRVIFDPSTAKEVQRQKKARTQTEKPIIQDEADESSYILEEEVKTVTEAVNYCAEHFNFVVKTASQAKEVANSNGVDFPNLKVGKK